MSSTACSDWLQHVRVLHYIYEHEPAWVEGWVNHADLDHHMIHQNHSDSPTHLDHLTYALMSSTACSDWLQHARVLHYIYKHEPAWVEWMG